MRSAIGSRAVLAWVAVSVCVLALAGCAAPGLPVTRSDYLSAVSCVSASSCVAVGVETVGAGMRGTTVPVAVRWDGSRWRRLAVRLPSGAAEGMLHSVSCKPGGCLAVGEYFPASGYGDVALAEYWDDSAWAPVALAFPPGPGNQALAAVSCVTARWCAAAGYYNSARGGDSPLAATWDGHAWSRSQPPGPAGAWGGLVGISCVTAGYCLAVGYATGKVIAARFTETWSGRGWAYAPEPLAASVPAGVSCRAAGHCVVVGWQVAGGPVTGASELLDGAHWTDPAMPMPVPQWNQSNLYGVSCAGKKCLAVGQTEALPAALTWNGATWTSLPTPRGTRGALYGVTCVTATDCVAVGSAPSGSNASHDLSEFWNGTAWTIVNVNTTQG